MNLKTCLALLTYQPSVNYFILPKNITYLDPVWNKNIFTEKLSYFIYFYRKLQVIVQDKLDKYAVFVFNGIIELKSIKKQWYQLCFLIEYHKTLY